MANKMKLLLHAFTFFICFYQYNAKAAVVQDWSKTCIAANWLTGVLEPVQEINVFNPSSGLWGFTSHQPNGSWLIQFNTANLRNQFATPTVLKFLFYHECSHARFNTSDEGIADCRGLEAMKEDTTVTKEMIDEIRAAYESVGRPFPSGQCG